MTSLFEFGEDLRKLWPKYKLTSIFVDTVYVCTYIYLVSSYHKHWIRLAIIKIYSPSVFQSNYILVFNSKYNEFIFQMLSLNWL